METKDISLDEYILKKNIKLLVLALNIFIYSNKFYGNKEMYNDDFLSNITTVIKSYKTQFFNAGINDVDMDLMLGVDVSFDYNEESYKYSDFYTFRASFKIDKGLKNFKIKELKRGDKLIINDKKLLLNKKLIPVNFNDFTEEIAEDFLKEFSPENLEAPAPLFINKIINKMGLEVIEAKLSPSIKGMITFRDNNIQYVTHDNTTIINQGTIIVNENLNNYFNAGVLNNTIIHECVHWWLHRKYMESNLLLNSDQSLIVCPSDNELYENNNSDLFNIEMQARILTPLILMPKDTSIMKFEEILHRNLQGEGNSKQIYEKSLAEFANYFGVTIASAANRLNKLGYNDTLKKDINLKVKRKSETYFLSYWDYCQVSNDIKLAQLINSELLVYVDGFIVPNIKRLFKEDNNGKHLTDIALRNITSYAIPFSIKWDGSGIGDLELTHSLLYNTGTAIKRVIMNEDAIIRVLNLYKMEPKDPHSKEFFKTFRYDDTKACGSKYSEYLIIMMQRHNISIRMLADKAKVSKSTIDNYRKYEEQPYTLQVTLKLCIGMNAFPYETINLLALMNYNLDSAKTESSKVYLKLITEYYDKDLDFWNEYLKEHGISVL